MENNFFTRLYLAIVFLLEPLYKIISWTVWIFTNIDIFENYNLYKDRIIKQLFKQ